VFEIIRNLRPYFFSLREIENNVSLDIRLPLSWRYEDVVKPYRLIKTKIQDKNDKYSLLSLVSSATQEGYDVVTTCAIEIITLNKEEEEKQRLFQQKVKELQELFKKESLDKLKELSLFDEHGQETTTSNELVTEGNGKGPNGNSESQKETD
jgi:hypothetical protein